MQIRSSSKAGVTVALVAVVATVAVSASTSTAGTRTAQAPQARTIAPCNVLQRGPQGQAPTRAETLKLTPAEIKKLKASGKTYRVASFWSQMNDTVQLMIKGIKDTWKKQGVPITLSATTSSDFDAAKQTDQINTLVNSKPDAMIGILADPQALAPAVKSILAKKIPLVLWDVPGNGAYPTSIVTSNGRLAGCLAADQMAKAIGGKGKIASLPMKFAFYPTDQRVAGFNDRIKQYPNIQIVARDGATVFADGQQVGEGLLQRTPDLAGGFASWQDPAMGLVAAAKTLGRNSFAVTTVDLADNAALEIARCGILKAAVPQLAYDEGAAEATVVAKKLLGQKVPKYVVTNVPVATHANLLSVYKQVFHHAPSAQLKKAYVSSCS